MREMTLPTPKGGVSVIKPYFVLDVVRCIRNIYIEEEPFIRLHNRTNTD